MVLFTLGPVAHATLVPIGKNWELFDIISSGKKFFKKKLKFVFNFHMNVAIIFVILKSTLYRKLFLMAFNL
jgi:hypothetical protein